MSKILTFILISLLVVGCTRQLNPDYIYNKSVNAVVIIHQKDESDTIVGLGTGFFVRPNVIMTNNHVIASAKKLIIKTKNSEVEYDAEVIATSESHDVALIKIKDWEIFSSNEKWSMLTISDRDYSFEGDVVYAIGHPWGLFWTFSSGIVSSVKRLVPNKPLTFLQTQTKIYQGNSGGPLLDSRGYVVGMNAMMLSNEGGSYGFVIPARYLHKVMGDLLSYKKSDVRKLGIKIDMSKDKKHVIIKESTNKSCQMFENDKVLKVTYENKYFAINNVTDLLESVFLIPMRVKMISVLVDRGGEKKELKCEVT